MNPISLDRLPINTYGKVAFLTCSGTIRRRFLDLGLVEGTVIHPLFISPLGDPIAYEIRGSTIALRKEDAQKIKVVLE